MALTLQAKALLLAWGQRHPSTAPPQAGITFALAQAIGEGSFTHWFLGTNNWGAMHATDGFARHHAADKGYGMVAFLDSLPTLGFYIARMLVVPSMAIGASMFLSRVEADVGDLTAITDETSYATALYVSGYYTGRHDPSTPLKQRAAAVQAGSLTDADKANIADYVSLIVRQEHAAAAAVAGAPNEQGDPTAITVGPPFATLAERLTPGPPYKPHTLEHAVQLLDKNASAPPPGGISLADAQAAGGDGVWLFGSGQPPGPSGPQPAPTPRPVVTPGSVAAVVIAAAVGVAVGWALPAWGARV
jgi:hypothetical protein